MRDVEVNINSPQYLENKAHMEQTVNELRKHIETIKLGMSNIYEQS